MYMAPSEEVFRFRKVCNHPDGDSRSRVILTRCDLQPNKVAVWWSTKYALRLNAFAAAVLLQRCLLEPIDIEPCRSREYLTTQKELFPLQGGVSSILGLMVTQTTAIAQLFYKPKKGIIKTFTVWPLVIVDLHTSLNSIPEFYGSTARHPQIDGIASGLAESGKSLVLGFADAISGLVLTPKRGHEKHGVAGAIGGVFSSLLDLQLKPAFGVLGLVAHPIKGAFVSYDRWKRKGNDPLRASRLQGGRDALNLASENEQQEVIRRFQNGIHCTDQRRAELLREAELAMKEDEEYSSAPNTYAASRSGTSTPVPPYEEKRPCPEYAVEVQERPPTPPPKDTIQAGFFL
ncbi:hypothetical protein QFC20_005553 [Naganishia adeliensis]|uniref:Uncharacterized protein n=1 Tax=Naganishia adeliensis TaxID=92952 RepID=A0ACC2VMZ1_9TREE|nr:hypothetical protein QFC20_005553 [Naganishia adeliensis]